MILTDGDNPVTLPLPMYGYSTEIRLPLVYSQRRNGSYGIYDQGSTYDRRYCQGLIFDLSETEMGSLVNLLKDPEKGRGEDLELQLGSDPTGFYPFGCDLGDKNTFTVRAKLRSGNMVLNPFRYFQPELELSYVSGPDVEYSFTDDVDDGDIQIGTITGIGYPKNGFDTVPDKYDINDVIVMTGNSHEIDSGQNSDIYECFPILYGRYSKIAALLDYLIGTVRGSNITIIFPDYGYPFGKEKSASGSMSIQPLYSKINQGKEYASIDLRHTNHNYFEMKFGMRFVS